MKRVWQTALAVATVYVIARALRSPVTYMFGFETIERVFDRADHILERTAA
ncbi:MAG TPA: hypothetical protein VEG32_05195 [Clostridia bacterium]|nr:hypothetical protein [Clostridia bacterium]